ncbi:divergent protein kinase domain 1B-like isoform X2 [Liolophura sinensis]|uniref:divergent protein kinase domain 1B-like isoform X2 n=1 Tax=Liolophura sinensis TaxID=3198878 RepID=UPI00315870A5
MKVVRWKSLRQIGKSDTFIQYCALVGIAITFVIILMSVMWYDPCGGGQITKHLCEQYEEGLVAGSLCYKICREQSVYLQSCVSEHQELKVFSFQNYWLKVPKSLSVMAAEGQSSDLMPPDGATIEQFKAALASFLNFKLDKGDHSALITSLLMFADFNQDQQLSLAEAQSLWSLVQTQDFLMLFVFRRSKDHFTRLNETCGSLYSVEQIHHTRLYQKHDTYFQRLFPQSYLWYAPEWKHRANIAVGILDFVFTVYEQDGVIYNMCDMTPSNFGYTAQYEFKVIDLTFLHSKNWLRHRMKNVPCVIDEDCASASSCPTICDKLTEQCSSVLQRPNLSAACGILQDYILPEAPKSIQSELERLLKKCHGLDNHSAGQDMQQMVLSNQLFILIFDQIKFGEDSLLWQISQSLGL